MPLTTPLRAGTVAFLGGIFLFWGIPVWLRVTGLYPLDPWLAFVLFWFCVSLMGAGGLLLFRGALGSLALLWPSDRKLTLFPGMVLRNVLPWHHHRLAPLVTALPNFGLIYGAVLWIVLFIFMIARVGPGHAYGLPIDFGTHHSVVWEKSPWQESLSVYLAVGEKYYLNGQAVPRDDLRTRLQQELDKRVVWTVYFEADDDTLYANAIYAMDTIQGLGAKLIWITPEFRRKLQQRIERKQFEGEARITHR